MLASSDLKYPTPPFCPRKCRSSAAPSIDDFRHAEVTISRRKALFHCSPEPVRIAGYRTIITFGE